MTDSGRKAALADRVRSVEPDVGKIAVLRANGIGDFMFALPALEALKAAYPAAEITLLACDWHRRFLENRPAPVDRVIAIPPSRGVREDGGTEDPAALDRFFEAMRRERFDLAVQLHGGGRHSNPFTRRLGARLSIGLQAPDAEPLDRVVPYVYFQSEIVRYLGVVALVGARPHTLEPSVAVTAADVEEALPLLDEENRARPLVVLHPAASDPRRRWPAECFAQVARILADDGARVAVIGIGEDQELVERVVALADGGAENFCNRLTLNGLAGLLSRTALAISNDSGPLHLASAVGAATVGIYWCGNVITAAPLTRSRHRPLLSWRLACPVCGADTTREGCPHQASFVADVPTAEVVSVARGLLGRPAD